MPLTTTANNKIISKENLLKKINFYKKVIFDLTKIRITFMVAITTIVGYILFSSKLDFKIAITTIGVFLLACGASALNEYQERNSDLLMTRTKNRPIPSGRITPFNALVISVVFILLGAIFLGAVGFKVMLLGFLTLCWYNFVYTPLKFKHALAILPGSLIGALPPIIGWTSAGGNISEPSILIFGTFLFIWQIPHFWLLLLLYDDDYRAGGFPTLTKIFSNKQLSQLTFTLIVTLVLFSSSLLLYSIANTFFNIFSLFLLGIILLILSSKILFKQDRIIFRNSFLYVNFYVLLVLILIVFDKTINFT